MDGRAGVTLWLLLIMFQVDQLVNAHQVYNPDFSLSDLSVPSFHPGVKKSALIDDSKVIFLLENNTNIVSQIDTTVVFHCAAENVGENTVSWIRRKDYHLLTVGTNLYSSDARFQIRFIENITDWQLHIRYVQLHDSGAYECQISSHPPISLFVHLIVVEAISEILGGPEKYLRIGSSLRLVCILKQNTQPASYMFWYLNNKMINYDDRVKVESSGEISVLFLSNLAPESSGNYSCVPSNAKPSTIHIQVLRGGELPAAIHSRAPSRITCVERNTYFSGLLIVIMSTYKLSSYKLNYCYLVSMVVQSIILTSLL